MNSLRVSVLDVQDLKADTKRSRRVFSLKQFEAFLESPTTNTPTATTQRLFLIESPSSNYELNASSKLRQLLRTKLLVPEDMFEIHQWRQTTFRFNETINCHRLPTTFYPKAKYSLEYFELWEVSKDAPLGRYMGNTKTVMCAMTGRQIQCHKWSNSSSWLMIAPRKCTYWARRGPDGFKGQQTLKEHSFSLRTHSLTPLKSNNTLRSTSYQGHRQWKTDQTGHQGFRGRLPRIYPRLCGSYEL